MGAVVRIRGVAVYWADLLEGPVQTLASNPVERLSEIDRDTRNSN
jgi:hypothetical protein